MTNHPNNGNKPGQSRRPQGTEYDPTALPPRGYSPVHQAPHDYIEPVNPHSPQHRNAGYYEQPGQHAGGQRQDFQPVVAPEPEQQARFIEYKKRPNRFMKLMQMMMSLTFFTAILVAGLVMYSRYQVDKPGPLAEDSVFEVGKGQGLGTIADRLEKQGIIRSKRLFKLNPSTIRVAKKLKAGKFAIPRHASIQQVLDILVRGRAIFYKVTIPEGLTSQQAVAILNAHPQLSGTINMIPPEGSLMPNTYQFDAGANRADILTKMAAMQQSFITRHWEQRQKNLPLKTPQEALILASIVEKETGISSERKRVAGVFVNRLRKGIKLQSDPTIIYGLVGGQGKLGHPLRRSEMKKKTGYNTYHIDGLPPTPIANPGPKSIEAVLHPADTKDLFFVANGTGGHSFAPNLKIHNQNVRKWRKIEAARRAEKKRKEEEQKRLAALESKTEPQEETIAGITLGETNSTSPKRKNGWSDDIPLPTRKPR